MSNLRFDALMAAAGKIRSIPNRVDAYHIIDEAAANADYTIHAEKAAPESDWDRLFTGSIGVLLSHGDYSRHVVSFFATRGISF